MLKRIAVLAAAAAFVGGAVNASTLLFDFEDANNGDKAYEKYGYVYEPINLNSSQHCAEDGANPKHCFLEVNQGDPTELYEGAIVDAKKDEFTATGDEFDLLAFYINFQGEGTPEDNTMYLYTEAGALSNPKDQIDLGGSYDGSGNFTVYLASDVYQGIFSAFTGVLEKQVGYFIVINDDYFDNITSFFWDASEGANIRIDCVAINHHDGETNDANLNLKDLTVCAQSLPPEIPVPGGLPLMATALGLVGILTRKSWRAAA